MASPLRSGKKKASAYTFREISCGKRYAFKRTLTRSDVEAFARLSGDRNPLHLDEAFARQTPFGGTIIHGMLASSLFSTLAGMYCPGAYALIVKQEIKYLRPIAPGTTVTVTGKVASKVDAVKVVVIHGAILGKKAEKAVECIMTIQVTR